MGFRNPTSKFSAPEGCGNLIHEPNDRVFCCQAKSLERSAVFPDVTILAAQRNETAQEVEILEASHAVDADKHMHAQGKHSLFHGAGFAGAGGANQQRIAVGCDRLFEEVDLWADELISRFFFNGIGVYDRAEGIGRCSLGLTPAGFLEAGRG